MSWTATCHHCLWPQLCNVSAWRLYTDGKANFCCNGFCSKGNVKHANTAERRVKRWYFTMSGCVIWNEYPSHNFKYKHSKMCAKSCLSLANLIPLQQKAFPIQTTRGIKCKCKHKQESWKIFCSRKIFTALMYSPQKHSHSTLQMVKMHCIL